MNITQQTIVGELVAEDYRTAAIFKSHGIDFCCNGNRSIQDACDKKQLDSELIIAELKEVAAAQNVNNTDYQ